MFTAFLCAPDTTGSLVWPHRGHVQLIMILELDRYRQIGPAPFSALGPAPMSAS
jgi:hypothetical protein